MCDATQDQLLEAVAIRMREAVDPYAELGKAFREWQAATPPVNQIAEDVWPFRVRSRGNLEEESYLRSAMVGWQPHRD